MARPAALLALFWACSAPPEPLRLDLPTSPEHRWAVLQVQGLDLDGRPYEALEAQALQGGQLASPWVLPLDLAQSVTVRALLYAQPILPVSVPLSPADPGLPLPEPDAAFEAVLIGASGPWTQTSGLPSDLQGQRFMARQPCADRVLGSVPLGTRVDPTFAVAWDETTVLVGIGGDAPELLWVTSSQVTRRMPTPERFETAAWIQDRLLLGGQRGRLWTTDLEPVRFSVTATTSSKEPVFRIAGTRQELWVLGTSGTLEVDRGQGFSFQGFYDEPEGLVWRGPGEVYLAHSERNDVTRITNTVMKEPLISELNDAAVSLGLWGDQPVVGTYYGDVYIRDPSWRRLPTSPGLLHVRALQTVDGGLVHLKDYGLSWYNPLWGVCAVLAPETGARFGFSVGAVGDDIFILGSSIYQYRDEIRETDAEETVYWLTHR